MKSYSAHSDTEFYETDNLKEAIEVAQSMAEHFGSSYIINNQTNEIIERF
jgi:hypothetical protein